MLLMDNYGTPEKAPVFTVEFKIVMVGQSRTEAASSEQLPSRDPSPSGLATTRCARVGEMARLPMTSDQHIYVPVRWISPHYQYW